MSAVREEMEKKKSRIEGVAGWLLGALLLPGAGLRAQPSPFLVQDLNPSTQVDVPPVLPWFSPVVMGSVTFYAGYDGIHGYELWRTDGTAAGTWMVRDICLGACGSAPEWLAAAEGTLFFAADDGVHGEELWASDGTAAGSRLVADLWPGRNGSRPRGIAGLGSKVVLAANTPGLGIEPWVSDGTAAGTISLGDLVPGLGSSVGPFRMTLGQAGSTSLLCLRTSSSADELWATDGTAGGTVRLGDLNPGANLTCVRRLGTHPRWDPANGSDGRLYFSAEDLDHGMELWASDGSAAGTVLVADIVPGPEGSAPSWLSSAGDRIFFFARDEAEGAEPWVTDGTNSGTSRLADVVPGDEGLSWVLAAPAGERFFFSYLDDLGRHLWVSDGTGGGTSFVRSFPLSESNPTTNFVGWMKGLEDRLLFAGFDASTGFEPWISDGTAAYTSLLGDLNPGPGDSFQVATVLPFLLGISFDRDRLITLGDRVVFRAFDPAHGPEVWISDGTSANTRMVADIDQQTSAFLPRPSVPAAEVRRYELADGGGHLYFGAENGAGRALWRAPGDATPPVRLTGLGTAGTLGAGPEIVPLGTSAVFLNATTETWELWFSDGTPSGTRAITPWTLVTDIPDSLTAFAGEVFGTALDLGPGCASIGCATGAGSTAGSARLLLRTDGLSLEVADPRSLETIPLLAGADYLYYVVGETVVRRSPEGQIENLLPASGLSYARPVPLAEIGGTLFFQASDTGHGPELWWYDSARTGAQRLPDIAPGQDGSLQNDFYWVFPRRFAAAGSYLFLAADDGTTGLELWRADGSGDAPRRVADLLPGSGGSEPEHLTAAGDRLFFVADDGVHGRELWTVQGGGAPTLLADLVPGAGSSQPTELAAADGKLFWSAWTATHGREPWVSDGTPAGTRLAGDIAPGPASSSPAAFTQAGGRVYFVANDNTTGFELWAVEAEILFIDGFETGDLSAWSTVVPGPTPASATSALPLR